MNSSSVTLRITGLVVDAATGQGLPDLRVEAWDADLLCDDLVGSAVTGADGAFQMRFTPAYFRELFVEDLPDLYFRVYQGQRQVADTERAVMWNVSGPTVQVRIPVDAHALGKPAPGEKRFVVRGRITDAAGAGRAGLTVRAFDKGSGGEVRLGDDVTDGGGAYRVSYTSARFGPGRESADLVVRAYTRGAQGAEEEVAASPLILHAYDHETVNLLVDDGPYRGPDEFRRVDEALAAALEGMELERVDAQGAAALAGRTGLQPLQVAAYVRARRDAEAAEASAEALYGLYRMGLPTGLPRLLAQDTPLLERALAGAAAANLVSRQAAEGAAQTVAGLVAKGAELVVRADAAEAAGIRDALALAGLKEDEQRRFVAAYAGSRAAPAEFWAGVANELGARRAARLQDTLQLTALTFNNLPLVQALQARDDVRSPRDLAALDAKGWLGVIQAARVPVPARVAGETEEERRSVYAAALARSVEAAFPTAVLAHRWKAAGADLAVAAFFDANPEFELGADRVSAYLAENPRALRGAADAAAAAESLLGVERLFRIAPQSDRFQHIQPLYADGVRSAAGVRTLGRSALLTRYATEDTRATYSAMYDRAVHVTDVALNAYFRYGRALNGTPMYVLPDLAAPAADQEGTPDLEALFGAQDYCACEDCVSVLGPSAYLTDLLAFLDGATAQDGNTGLEKLFDRRPDLGNVQLTCDNSHTPLPYIDLVNEVLENAVSPRLYANQTHGGTTLRVSGAVPQTEAEARELKANPEHLNPQAYDTLAQADAIYPWNLPFGLWREEAAVYLDHLQQPRHELIELFRPADTVARAAEYLGLLNSDDAAQANEVALLTTPSAGAPRLRQAWGVSNLAALNGVLTFLRQAGLKHAELLTLLETRFVNPTGAITLAFDKDEPCSLAAATLNGLTPARLDRIHRFVRLQRRLGWTAPELDRALAAAGAGEITPDVLRWLADVLRLRRRFAKVGFDALLGWWGAAVGVASYRGEPSLYDRLFLNRAVHTQQDEIEAVFGLNAARTELADASRALTDPLYSALVLAAAGLTEEDMLFLVQEELGGSGAMTLASLSHLYRISSFCRALRLRVREYRSLRVLSGIRPLSGPGAAAQPAHTVAFVELVDELRAGKVAVETLDYVLRHAFTATAAVPPQEDETALLLEEMRAALQTIRDDQTPDDGEDPRAVLENRLSLVLADDPGTDVPRYTREEKVQMALAIVDRTSQQATAAQEAFIDDDLDFLPDPANAKATLLAPLNAADPAEDLATRYAYVLQPLLAYLIPLFMDEYLVRKLSVEMELEAGITSDLLAEYLAHPGDPTRAAIEFFRSAEFLDGEAPVENAGAHAAGFTLVERLYKIALVANQLGIRDDDVPFVFEAGPTPPVGWLDLASLPLAPAGDALAKASFDAWLRMFRTYRLQKKRFGEAYSVVALIERAGDPAQDRAGILADLAAQTGWSPADVATLAGPEGFDVKFAAAGGADTDEGWLLRMDAAFQAITRTGVSAAQLIGWATDGVSREQAWAVRNAAKARYDLDEWLGVAGGLRDVLRERQRDALQGYVIHKRGFRDENELYAFYLIDTEMSACMLTSRIRQAISSVQLFVQRILMNLEADQIEFTREDAEEWAWRKTYRVWEANRKVFLYPENWIEPELRDDRTPFFRDLENELLQDDVNDAAVERAYLNYLRRLDEVAHLDIRAAAYDPDADLTHVFSRTHSKAHRWFHRTWRNGEGVWTPWTSLELDIEGDHAVTFLWNRRLYLCWATFTERAIEEDPSGQEDAQAPKRFYEIQLGWSEYRDGAWGPSRLSDGMITSRFLAALEWSHLPEDFVFQPTVNPGGEGLTIRCRWRPEDDNIVIGRFKLDGCREGFYARDDGSIGLAMYTPENAEWRYAHTRSLGDRPLALRVTEAGSTSGSRVVPVLNEGLDFRVVLPINRNVSFNAQSPFLYRALDRTFFVLPEDAYRLVATGGGWKGSGGFDVGQIDAWGERFIPPEEPVTGVPWLVDPLDDPMPEWFTDPAMGVVYDGARSAGAVLDRANPAAGGPGLRSVASGPAMTPTSMMRAMATAMAGGGAQVSLFSARGAAVPRQGALGVGARAPAPASAPAPNRLSAGASAGTAVTGEWTGTQWSARERAQGTAQWAVQASGSLSMTNSGMAQVGEVLAGAGRYTWSGFKQVWDGKRFTFRAFYHPYSCLLIKHLNRYGVEGILAPDPGNGAEAESLLRQQARAEGFFDDEYDPSDDVVRTPHPVEEFDFSYAGAYSQYNWELFFHVPLLIAVRLMQNQRFAEAQKWFHYVFDPTEVEGPVPERFWKFRPFHEFNGETQIAELMVLLSGGDDEMEKQVAAWEADPFDPHAIARLRTVAYMRAVVMKYIDNLVAWGDYLFRQDTMETINEATQLYVLADQILGRRPEQVEGAEPEPRTFNQLYPDLDAFSNALVQVESAIQVNGGGSGGAGSGASGTLASLLYFCIPGNPNLLRYWDTVADRLFKIRNCMNIEGVRRSLALYDPPIDPGMLVRAAAAGVDLSSALGDLFAPLPGYRFTFMADRAVELARDVQALGGALLSALERRDAEELAQLRAGHERDLLKAVEEVKKQAVREAELTREGLLEAKAQADLRHAFYRDRLPLTPGEAAQLTRNAAAPPDEENAANKHDLAAIMNLIPSFSVGIAGFGGSPNLSVSYGGSNIAGFLSSKSAALSTLAGMARADAGVMGIVAGYARRQEEWDHQEELAALESRQTQQQIDAADVRIRMAERELDNHRLQLEHSQAVYDFLRGRFSSRELYGWMITQISTLYFQAYQLAYQTARRAERTFRHELGTYDTSYIQFGYWDSLKKGLLAGDRLLKDVRRMQMAYVEQNRREQELVKHVSLLQLNPAALLTLREDGVCEFAVPEAVFDLDYPGQYMRRIRSVSVSLPCVAGPYTTISGRLTLLNSRVRTDPSAAGSYAYTGITDARFLHNLVGVQSISTSSAQADSGLFELSFRDERYLPFEGAGAVSSWRLELPSEFRQFDYDSIADVVLHISYTAREGGELLKEAVQDDLEDSLNLFLDVLAESQTGLERLISIRGEFPNEFHQMLHPPADTPQATTVQLRREHFPYALRDRDLTLLADGGVTVYVKQAEGDPLQMDDVELTARAAGADGAWSTTGDLHAAAFAVTGDPLGPWELDAGLDGLPPEQVEDVYLLLRYTIA
jgi:hypothetical protein